MRLVIPSVGYADYLRDTLPAWREAAPDALVCVVTSRDDAQTIAVAHACGALVETFDGWHDDGALFNKAGALDAALYAPARPHTGEVCVVADADVYPMGVLDAEAIRFGVLYGVPRYQCLTRLEFAEVKDDHRARERLPLILPRRKGEVAPRVRLSPCDDEIRVSAGHGLGYLHVFRFYAGLGFGSSRTAGGTDTRFARRFRGRAPLPGDFYVLHLGPLDRENWKGRMLPAWGAA